MTETEHKEIEQILSYALQQFLFCILLNNLAKLYSLGTNQFIYFSCRFLAAAEINTNQTVILDKIEV